MIKAKGAKQAPFFIVMNDDFYKAARWEKLRELVLRRDMFVCQYFKRLGRLVQADLVHHCFPRTEFPEYQYDPWNLLSLSRRAHNRLHDRFTDELTEEGRQVLVRVGRKNNIPIPDKFLVPIEDKTCKRYERKYHKYDCQ